VLLSIRCKDARKKNPTSLADGGHLTGNGNT